MFVLFDPNGNKNWVTKIRLHLYQLGFGYVWDAQGVGHISLFFVYSTDMAGQNWSSKCQDSSKF
jgi:hypothetical protein